MSYGYLGKMLAYLTSAYNRSDILNIRHNQPPSTNIGKLFGIFGCGLEIIHENSDRMKLWDDIYNARGAVLDRYGKNFGVQRAYTDDDFYRVMIEVKMLSQLSGGDINTMIHAAASLFDVPEQRVELQEVFPAKIWLLVNELDLDETHLKTAPLAAQMLKRIKAAGVGSRVFLKNHYAAQMQLYTGVANHITDQYRLNPTPLRPVAAPTKFFVGVSGLQQIHTAVQPHTDTHRHTRAQPPLYTYPALFEHVCVRASPCRQQLPTTQVIATSAVWEHRCCTIRPIKGGVTYG